jgi:hypothetical protein
MSQLPGYWRLDHKLHPQTAFMIFVPGAVIVGGILLLAFSHAPGKWGGIEGGLATFGIGVVAISFGLYSNFGNTVSWDNDAVHVRQGGSRLFFRRHPFACVPFADIRGFVLHPPPRGVPPKFPLLEIDAPGHADGPPLFIDPNYFKASSLAIFVNDLREHVPEMRSGPQAKVAERLLKLFAPRRR